MKKTVLFLIFIFLCCLCAFADTDNVLEKSGEINVINGDIGEARRQLVDRTVKNLLNDKSISKYFGDSVVSRFSYTVTDENYDKENQKYYLTVKLEFKENVDNKFADYIKPEEFVVVDGVLVKYNGNRKKIDLTDIKDKNNKPVKIKEIGDNVFYNSDLEEIILPDSLEKIGDCAFHDCKKLKKIKIPDTVNNIGVACFCYCVKLESVNIPKHLKVISNQCFYNCSSLLKIDIPDSVTELGLASFSNCKELREIIIPGSVKSLGNSCFQNCLNLNKVILSDNLINIPDACFAGCNLSEIIIPDSVTKIGKIAFSDNKNIANIKIGSGVRTINEYAFFCFPENKMLKTLFIPKNVIEIQESAFSAYSCLEELKFEEGIEKIGGSAFSSIYNDKLTELELPDSLKTIGEFAFSGFNNLKKCVMSKDTMKYTSSFDFGVEIKYR